MAHSKRDIINTERAKRAEGIGADPGIEVGATTHGTLVGASVGGMPLLSEAGDELRFDVPAGSTIDRNAEGDIVIHNAEQNKIIEELAQLKRDTDICLDQAKAMRNEDENLYRQDVDWDMVGCPHAERWIDDSGLLGWRVGIAFADPSATKLMAWVAGKLERLGWEDVIVEAWGG